MEGKSPVLRNFPAYIYLFKVKFGNRNTKKRYEICSKLTLKTPERSFSVFIVKFEHISHLLLVFEQVNVSWIKWSNSNKFRRCSPTTWDKKNPPPVFSQDFHKFYQNCFSAECLWIAESEFFSVYHISLWYHGDTV